MKSPLVLALVLVALVVPPLCAVEDAMLSAVERADDARVAAVIAEDVAKLDGILSDELRYCHSSGAVDTKASYLAAIRNPRSRHLAMNYEERTFTPVASGVVLMTGRVLFKSENDGAASDLHLTFLGVWRLENGGWRFFAWQSCKLPLEPAKP